MRLQVLLSLCVLVVTASPVHQLGGSIDDFTSALFSPSPTPSVSTSLLPSTSSSPLPTISITPTANPSQTSENSPTPLPSTTPEPETTPTSSSTPEPETTPASSSSPAATASNDPSITPSPADELLPPIDGGFDDFNDDDDDDEQEEEEEQTDAFGFSPDQVTEEASPKSAENGIATAPSTISALALVGIAVAILAPAVIIFWFVRRRSASGFENMPRVETDTYRGSRPETFTVA